MEWVIDPAADVVWDSVKSISTEAGTKEVSPQTDEQWAACAQCSRDAHRVGQHADDRRPCA
jgi:hypothetical protein